MKLSLGHELYESCVDQADSKLPYKDDAAVLVVLTNCMSSEFCWVQTEFASHIIPVLKDKLIQKTKKCIFFIFPHGD